MFRCTVDFKPVSRAAAKMKTFSEKLKQVNRVAARMAKVVEDHNRKYALQGVDVKGQAYAPLRPSTIDTRPGNGPPLAPRGTSSRVVKNFYCRPKMTGQYSFELIGGWSGDTEWMRYHFTGYRHVSGRRVPARNPNSLRDVTRREIEKMFSDFFINTARATFRVTSYNEA